MLQTLGNFIAVSKHFFSSIFFEICKLLHINDLKHKKNSLFFRNLRKIRSFEHALTANDG